MWVLPPSPHRILYLHGFASGPHSRKAQFFAFAVKELGWNLEVPDLTEGKFERLTVGRQLSFLEEQLGGESAILIGSSLGGYLAALYAARHSEIQRLLLLAPAFDFSQLWINTLGKERLAAWRRNGSIPVFHYGAGREVPLAYDFIEDAQRFEAYPDARQPTLIFHGDADQVVPVERSVVFSTGHPSAKLLRVTSGHELTDVLDSMWREAKSFLVGEQA